MSFWLDRLAPDLGATLRRFPFAIILAALATVLSVILVNDGFEPDSENWARLMLGFATAAAFAVGGRFFTESRPGDRSLGLLLTYAVPSLVVLAMQVQSTTWILPYTLPVVGVMWVSVSAFTKIEQGKAREEAQNRFWWLNHRAIVAGVIAAVAFFVIAVGIFAIERSLALLFGLELETIFYRYILPVAGMFLAPVYWLSTLPELDEFSPDDLTEPDFLSRAIGFLGQFLLAPLLGAYALILMAHGVQIIFTWSLPQGVLGWMVLAFTVTGAATWLVLHPPFMRERQIVGWFRKGWFWLTIIPLALYALAVGIRIDAYGLTPERLALVSGGVWAGLLTLAFLVPRFGDIRLIPALAGLVILVFSIGPWNYVSGAISNQASRLDAAISSAFASGEEAEWTTETAATAKGAARFLLEVDDAGRAALGEVLSRHGITDSPDLGWSFLSEALQIPSNNAASLPYSVRLSRESDDPVLIRSTPYAYGSVLIWQNGPTVSYGYGFELTPDETLEVSRDDVILAVVPLSEWIDAQQPPEIVAPALDFAIEGRAFRLIVSEADLRGAAGAGGDTRQLTYIAGTLFSATAE